MIDFKDLDNYERLGRGKVFQFFITQKEFFEILLSTQESLNTTFSLITSDWDKKSTKWNYSEFDITKFPELVDNGKNIFLLRDYRLSPKIDLIKEVDYEDGYYLFNGLIKIRFNYNLKSNELGESYLMFFDKIKESRNNHLIVNKEYLKIYGAIKRKIEDLLNHTGSFTGKSGKTYYAKNISVGYKKDFNNGIFKSRLELVE